VGIDDLSDGGDGNNTSPLCVNYLTNHVSIARADQGEGPRMTSSRSRSGFTLIELLTVIAIITILVAILFPVFAQVRRRVQEEACMSNMHQIYQAMNMYRDTWDRYPFALGRMAYRAGGVSTPFFPLGGFLKSEAVLRCPLNFVPADNQVVTDVVKWFPDPRGISYISQFRGGFARVDFPLRESYDAAIVPNRTGGTFEAHYVPDWTEPLRQTPPVPPALDFPSQLKYRSPEPSTVVTWCMNHATVDNNGEATDNVLVLYLDGTVRKKRGEDFSRSRWAAQWNPGPPAQWTPQTPPFAVPP
jgi:prepilin-type N-terminal cleavage/methylation domain-containing protein